MQRNDTQVKISKEVLLNSIILTGIMTLFISGVSTFKATGFVISAVSLWMSAWLTSWIIAIPLMYFVGPWVRKVTYRLVKK